MARSGRPHPARLLAIGVVTGVMSGLLGIGGGTILIPLLVWTLGFDQRSAQGNNLALAVVVVLANLPNYWLRGYVFYDAPTGAATLLTLLMGLAGWLAAGRSSTWALRLSAQRLGRIFAFTLGIAALWMIYGGFHDLAAGAHAPVRPDVAADLLHVLAFVAIGLVAGAASGVTGLGGNIVMIPLLTALLGIDQKYAQGFGVGAMLPIVFVGAQRYLQQRAGNLKTVALLAPGALLGVLAGGELLRRITSPQLQLVFGVFLIVVAGWQLYAGGPRAAATQAEPPAASGGEGPADQRL